MDFEIFHVQEDGTRVPVELSKLNDVLTTNNVVILVDHVRRRIFNFNGKEAKIRTRFIGARMAAEQIRSSLGMAYNIQAVEEGEENQKFRDLINDITCPGTPSHPAASQRPPSTPPVVKIFIDKDVAQLDKLRPPERSAPRPSVEESLPDLIKETKKAGSPQKAETTSTGMGRDASIDVTSIISQLGEVPAGYEVEAVILNNAVYKYALVRSKVLGKETEQTKVERIDTLEGIFTLDGQVKVVAKDGKVLGIEVLSKQKAPAVKKTKETTE
jgi:ribosomal protein L18E